MAGVGCLRLGHPAASPGFRPRSVAANLAAFWRDMSKAGSASGTATVSDNRQFRRLERMNGSRSEAPSSERGAPGQSRTFRVIRASPFPSPRPSPSGRGRMVHLSPVKSDRLGRSQRSDRQRGLETSKSVRSCSLSLSRNDAVEKGERDRPGRSVRRLAEHLVWRMPLTVWCARTSAKGSSAGRRRERSRRPRSPVSTASFRLRERVRVRGNEISLRLRPWTIPGTLEMGEPSGGVGGFPGRL